MKKVITLILLTLGTFAFAQKTAQVNMYVLDGLGNAIPNSIIRVQNFSTGQGYNIEYYKTDHSGLASGTMNCTNSGFLRCGTVVNNCADTVIYNFTSATAVPTFNDTLVVCSPADCNFSISATPLVTNSLSYAFSHTRANNTGNAWYDFGDGNVWQVASMSSPHYTYASAGIYVYCVSLENCPTQCDTVVVTGTPITTCNAYFEIDSATIAPGQLNIVDKSTAPTAVTLSYLWYFGDTASYYPTRYPSHTFTSAGKYPICVTINSLATPNAPACTSTYCDTITIDSTGNLVNKTFPGFTVNVVSSSSGIGIPETYIEDFKLYPNPSSENTTIEYISHENAEIDVLIFNSSGKIVLQENQRITSGENKMTLNTQNLESGFYYIRLEIDGTSKTEKFIKL
ncbi:MAG: T9SS type A sorting domain-containing protein [Schleiferiaceae bacterium]|jgi:hypothetical protein|nr:T9SS type A sorting domain-containing protein [Schleiferiaceae bacterium]